MTCKNNPSRENDQTLDPLRRALLQAAGVSLAALSCPRDLWAAPSGSTSTDSIIPIDFRYSPPWWQTSVCLPDDPDKALVGKEGQLFFDWGVRIGKDGQLLDHPETAGMRNFGVLLQPDIAEGATWLGQTMASPRVPIIQTWRHAEGVEVSEETFVVTPEPGETEASPRLARVDFPGIMTYGRTKPARGCSPAFSNAAIGGPIHFQLAVTPGAKVTLVYGVCVGHSADPGAQELILSAEGGETKTVHPLKDFGTNQPGIYKLAAHDSNHDGVMDIFVSGPADAPDFSATLNALWVFSGEVPPDEAIISGRADSSAFASFPAILEQSRRALVLMTLRNSSAVPATCQPVLRIRSVSSVTVDQTEAVVYVGNGTRVSGSAPLTLTRTKVEGEYAAEMPGVTVPPGGSHEVVFTVDRHTPGPAGRLNVDQAHALRSAAIQWWQNYGLPYTTIEVPDRSIQDMLESCVRNIWQARELKIGGPAFQVGPTCYRGLWVVDGSFLLESAAILGRGHDARSGIEYLLRQQKPDGSFEIISHYWKENGVVLWAATRHAFLTQDKEWLHQHWTALQRVMGAIRRLREEVSNNPQALNYRLMPGGFVDGGIDNMKAEAPEYSGVYWTLVGMKSCIAAARWLREEGSAVAYQKEYDDFYAVFRQACARDTLKDGRGNPYVPIMMGNAEKYVPQRGQWSFCHAVYPGQVFPQNDPLVAGQLAMLAATKTEGMVFDTGIMTDGIWTYFASFFGHAQLWQGRGREAVESLYAFAQHACPMRVWREEQKPKGQGSEEVGDMPHNWASAEFIRLTTHLIELDRGDELHLLEGFPREWAGGGMVTRLNGVLTPFGPLHLEIRVAPDARSAQVKMRQLSGRIPAKIILHLDGLAGKNEIIALPTDRDVVQLISLGTPMSNRLTGNGQY